MKATKIEKVEPILWDRWLLVRVYCEDGTVGIGEGGVHGWQRPTKTMVETFVPYLVGQDPAKIEHHQPQTVDPEPQPVMAGMMPIPEKIEPEVVDGEMDVPDEPVVQLRGEAPIQEVVGKDEPCDKTKGNP